MEIDLPYAAGPSIDLLVEVRTQGTALELIDAVVRYLELPLNPYYGLVRTMVRTLGMAPNEGIRYLPEDVPLAECGLLDGVTLTLADRSLRPAPTLFVDRDQADDDLYLIDERGTHRGRVTRLPSHAKVLIGLNPPDDGTVRTVMVDDAAFAPHALTLVNKGGESVQCEVIRPEGLYLSGAKATESRTTLLPGNTIVFRRDDTDYVSFVVTTKAALHGRSPVGRVQFDVTARLDTPKYLPLSEATARIRAQPKAPEHRPFPFEQVIIPIVIVFALWLATKSTISLIASPLAAAFPIFSYQRQTKLEKRRYMKERADWVAALETASRELAKLAGAEEGNLRLENPPPEMWALRAYRRLAGLWERDPGQEDFLRVRLGLGQLPSRYESRLEEGTDNQDFSFKRVMSVPGRDVTKDAVRPQLFEVPVTVDLRYHHLGLVGAMDLIDDVATDILVQISCAHPPGAVGIAALLPASQQARRRYEWLKWLPHTRAGSTLLPSARMVAGRDACDEFLTEMQRLHAERREHRAKENPDSYALVVVHEAAEVDLALLTEVCELADGLVRVVWLGSSKDTAPKLVGTLVGLGDRGQHDKAEDVWESTARILSGDRADEKLTFKLNMFRVEPLRTVHALAGLYDPRSSGASAGIPQAAPLSAVMELEEISYRSRPDSSLAESFPIPMGIGEAGVLDLDLIKQGPHVLIGGTTGSGKSELLQTLTCGAISRYSPAEVSLFLVDFKGGATFAPFRRLPHVVGYVTDLDQRNVNRALDFLRAELRRRERCFDELDHAKEYGDYLARALDKRRYDILPRLIVMFDEFATIVQDFERDTINAVIDIARRGRSWGVHLILATQQPTRDVVVPQVRGNVNARIALRTPSPDESQTIIDRPEAAHIPHNFPGRALMTLGGNRLVEFQTAFSGATFIPEDKQSRVLVAPFDVTARAASQAERPERNEQAERGEQGKQSQLQTLVSNVAAKREPPSPGAEVMLPALEDQDPWPSYAESPPRSRPGSAILWLGRRDLPKQQKQDELVADLGRGGLCLTGPNRSGITTAMVTVAEAFARQVAPDAKATVIAFDAAHQLRDELDKRFENTISLSMTRLDEVTRCVDQLWYRIRDRMADDADGRDPGLRSSESILLLIDGFEVLMRALGAPGGPALWASRLSEVLTLGRRVGIYSCISVRGARDLDRSIITSQAAIISLHGHYEEMNIPQEDRLPGYGLDPDGNLVQFFMPFQADRSRPRIAFDRELAAAFAPDRWRQAEVTPPAYQPDRAAVFGVGEIDHQPCSVPLTDTHVLVIGTPRSGRTKLLLTLAEQLAEQSGAPVAYFSPRDLPGAAGSANIEVITAGQLMDLNKLPTHDKRAAWLAELGVTQLKDGRAVLLADDCYAIGSLENGSTLNTVLGALYTQSLIQPIAVTTPSVLNTPLLEPLKKSGVTVYLRPRADRSDVDNGYRVRGVPLRHRPGMIYRKGDVIIQTDDMQFVAHMPELVETGIVP